MIIFSHNNAMYKQDSLRDEVIHTNWNQRLNIFEELSSVHPDNPYRYVGSGLRYLLISSNVTSTMWKSKNVWKSKRDEELTLVDAFLKRFCLPRVSDWFVPLWNFGPCPRMFPMEIIHRVTNSVYTCYIHFKKCISKNRLKLSFFAIKKQICLWL